MCYYYCLSVSFVAEQDLLSLRGQDIMLTRRSFVYHHLYYTYCDASLGWLLLPRCYFFFFFTDITFSFAWIEEKASYVVFPWSLLIMIVIHSYRYSYVANTTSLSFCLIFEHFIFYFDHYLVNTQTTAATTTIKTANTVWNNKSDC